MWLPAAKTALFVDPQILAGAAVVQVTSLAGEGHKVGREVGREVDSGGSEGRKDADEREKWQGVHIVQRVVIYSTSVGGRAYGRCGIGGFARVKSRWVEDCVL